MRRLMARVGLAGLVVALSAQVLVSPTATGATSVAAPAVTPTRPYVGDTFTVSGIAPGGFARTVRLQVWNGSKYTNRLVTTADSKGRYRFSRASIDTTVRLRTVTAATRRGSRSYPAVTTAVRTVVQRPNTVSLVAPPTVREGATFTARVTAVPAVAGRGLVLERRDGSVWRQVARGVTSADGTAAIEVASSASTDQRDHRVRVEAAGLRPAAVSGVVTVVVDPIEPVARVVIETDGRAAIESGEEYVRGTMRLEPRDSGLTALTLPGRFRVRGNTTSWARVKLSYKVKLDGKAAVAGFPESKDWALLGNFYDRSMLRNAVAFEAARRIGMPWVPRTVHAEVVVNGRLQGLYQLAENVEKAPGRVALPDDGVLLEADHWESDDPAFTTSRGLRVNLKDPDDGGDELTAEVAAGVQEAEDALYGEDFADPATGYRAHLDVDSFVDWYLVNELMKNLDSTFLASIWMSWSDGRVAMAAPWDFDFSAGNRTAYENTDPTGWYLRRNWWVEDVPRPGSMLGGPQGHWLVRMMQDPAFEQQVRERWQEVAPSLATLPDHLDDQVAEVGRAAARNYAPVEAGGAGQFIGPTLIDGPEHHVHQGSWPKETAALSSWLTARIAWMDDQLGTTGP